MNAKLMDYFLVVGIDEKIMIENPNLRLDITQHRFLKRMELIIVPPEFSKTTKSSTSIEKWLSLDQTLYLKCIYGPHQTPITDIQFYELGYSEKKKAVVKPSEFALEPIPILEINSPNNCNRVFNAVNKEKRSYKYYKGEYDLSKYLGFCKYIRKKKTSLVSF